MEPYLGERSVEEIIRIYGLPIRIAEVDIYELRKQVRSRLFLAAKLGRLTSDLIEEANLCSNLLREAQNERRDKETS